MTARDSVESRLLQEFPASIRPIDRSTLPLFERTEDGQFGNAYLAHLLYCNGWNSTSRSTRHPDGLVFSSDEAVFGIGCFVRDQPSLESSERSSSVHFVCPTGSGAFEAASGVAEWLSRNYPCIVIYARHLNQPQYREILFRGDWASIDGAPWHPLAPREDETFHHRRVVLEDLLDLTSSSSPVRTLSDAGSRRFRRKAHLAHNRFRNFLRRNSLDFILRPHAGALVKDVHGLIRSHFQDVSAQHELLGSSAQDYSGIASFVPPGDDRFHCRVGFLEREHWSCPVSFFAAERIGRATFGCYATITRRTADLLPEGSDRTGFSAVAQFALIEWLRSLARAGAQEVDLGGSETSELDRFKRQLGARQQVSYWSRYLPTNSASICQTANQHPTSLPAPAK